MYEQHTEQTHLIRSNLNVLMLNFGIFLSKLLDIINVHHVRPFKRKCYCLSILGNNNNLIHQQGPNANSFVFKVFLFGVRKERRKRTRRHLHFMKVEGEGEWHCAMALLET